MCSNHIGVLELATNLYKTIVYDTDVDHFRRFMNIVVDPTERLSYIMAWYFMNLP